MNGALRGQRFTLGPACYVIDRRPGYEHADIVLSMGTAATPCGPVAPRDAASVWFRHRGATRVDPEQVRIQPDAGGARLLLPLRRLA